jgi:hypothetical protein
VLVTLAMAGAGSALHAQNNGGGGNLSPEQRQQRMAEMREQAVRRTLTQANITDGATMIAHSRAQLAASRALQEKVRALNAALRNANSTNEQITPLLTDLRAAVTAEKARRAAALTALDTAVGYSKNARLEAALTLGGIIGDEASVLNAGGGGWGGGRGGRGGQG